MYAFGQALTAVNTAVKVRLIHSEHFFLSPKNGAVKKLSFFTAPFVICAEAMQQKTVRESLPFFRIAIIPFDGKNKSAQFEMIL